MPKYSIIIPTYLHLEDCLKPCVESIIQHTDLQDVEVIVVANGCGDDETMPYILSKGQPFKLLWIEEPAGYTVATNTGIKAASGEYVVLLNNDNVIMGRGWLDTLVAPFSDDLVAMTGAAKNFHKETSGEFLLFFCAMIRKSVFDIVGYPDEIFNPGYGEDIDFAHKVRKVGMKLVQVPNDITLNDLRPRDQHTLQFPIWHKGSVTVSTTEGWSEVVPRNEKLLLERYSKPLESIYIGNLLDRIPSSQIQPTTDKITSQLSENGVVFAKVDDRTTVVLSRTGFLHHVFVGKDRLPLLVKNNHIPDISTIQSIKEHVLNCGAKSMWQFGGKWEGGYLTQQDPDEVSAYLNDFKDLKVEDYLEIGCAEGGLTRLFCDVVEVNNVTHMDIGWADANYPLAYRQNLTNLHNKGEISIFRGDSHSPDAEKFLEGREFDFIFIDADHSYDSVVKDTQLAMRHAKEGAIFAYHDHIAVPEIGKFYTDLREAEIPSLRRLVPIKSYGNKFGISTFKLLPKGDIWAPKEESSSKKISIIIPTYNHLEDCLKPCLRSIINTTELNNLEVIIVANGCTDDTKKFVESLGGPFKLLWIDEPVGFIKATNAGIKASTGDFIVLLNNDTEILDSTWLYQLRKPFSNPTVGITGPYKDWRFFWDKGRLVFRNEYMVFYCAMIKREVFDKIGLLDEDFGIGYEEDIDFAVRAKRAGYSIVQVPEDVQDHLGITKQLLEGRINYNPMAFPVKHKDKVTFKEINKHDNTRKTSLLQKYPEYPHISIIIPTYNHLDYLKNCVESIKKYTDLSQVEVIIVANGCTDETRNYVNSLGYPFKLYWMEKRAGYIKAINAGISQSMGDYIVLLNNDTQLTPQEPDLWMKTLLSPFFDESVGITGPIKAWRDDIKAEYLLFWCVAIKRDVIDKIGLLDERFGEGYHEDVDFCIRAQRAGFKLIEVPNNVEYSDENKGDSNRNYQFPISHIGGGTFAPIYGESNDRLEKHLPYLYSKYPPPNPILPPGWFGYGDQAFYKELIKQVPEGGRMIEVGVWQGLSLCSAAELIKSKNMSILAVDTFKGSPWEGENGATVTEGLNLEENFNLNISRFGIRDRVFTCPLSSLDAAKTIEDDSLDLVFLDGDHRHESVIADIKAWLPKLKSTGWIAGHDYQWGDNVAPAVDSVFGRENVYSQSNIWYVIPENRNKKPQKVYDCFIFFNELDILEIRLNELNKVVDKFVLCEARYTHQGHPKPLYFEENKQRFAKFLPKIHHIILDEFPSTCVTTWDREHYQRNMMITALKDANPNDIIILSDADEILSAETVRKYDISKGVCSVQMPLYYYKLDWILKEPWFKPRIFPFSAVKNNGWLPTGVGNSQKGTLQWFRGEGDYVVDNQIDNGGWHFSFMGDKDSIRSKIQSYAHEEFNHDGITNDQNIEEAIEKGRDVFGRDLHFEKVTDFSTYPKFVQENLQYFRDKQLISSNKPRVFDCFSFFNELDLLEVRLNELYPYVDCFVLSQMEVTHSGLPKPLYFDIEDPRWAPFKDKIIVVTPKDIPQSSDPWVREHFQRDCILGFLKPIAKDSDIIIISDLDEIPRGSKIKEFKGDIQYFEQNQYSYYLNYNVGISPITPGTFSRITTYNWLMSKRLSMTGVRYYPLSESNKIEDGGWHFSWMGGPKNIVHKLESWAHQEFNKPELLNEEKILSNITQGNEHFGREGVGKTTEVDIDETFPKYIQEHEFQLIGNGLIRFSKSKPKVAIVMPYYNDKAMITKSVAAIMGQTFQNWELFIVDDGSDNNQRAIDILAAHPKIHHLYEWNQGPSSARNMALDIIMKDKSFTHIAFCDSDDIWDKSLLVSNLSKIGDNDVVYCSVNHVFENGYQAIPFGIPDPTEYPGRQVMLETPFIFISSVLCKREAIGFNRFDKQLDSIEDWEMWLRLDKQGNKFCHNPEKLVTYTVKNGMAGKRTDEQVNIIRNRYRVKELV